MPPHPFPLRFPRSKRFPLRLFLNLTPKVRHNPKQYDRANYMRKIARDIFDPARANVEEHEKVVGNQRQLDGQVDDLLPECHEHNVGDERDDDDLVDGLESPTSDAERPGQETAGSGVERRRQDEEGGA